MTITFIIQVKSSVNVHNKTTFWICLSPRESDAYLYYKTLNAMRFKTECALYQTLAIQWIRNNPRDNPLPFIQSVLL